MKTIFNVLVVLALLLSGLSGFLSLGSGLTVVGGVMMVVMFSADWFSLLSAGLTTLVVTLASIVWILKNL